MFDFSTPSILAYMLSASLGGLLVCAQLIWGWRLTHFEQWVHITSISPDGKQVVRRRLARGKKKSQLYYMRGTDAPVATYFLNGDPRILRMRHENDKADAAEEELVAGYLEPLVNGKTQHKSMAKRKEMGPVNPFAATSIEP